MMRSGLDAFSAHKECASTSQFAFDGKDYHVPNRCRMGRGSIHALLKRVTSTARAEAIPNCRIFRSGVDIVFGLGF
jgi:hypothetical protein